VWWAEICGSLCAQKLLVWTLGYELVRSGGRVGVPHGFTGVSTSVLTDRAKVIRGRCCRLEYSLFYGYWGERMVFGSGG
jgi:hypothetical protein